MGKRVGGSRHGLRASGIESGAAPAWQPLYSESCAFVVARAGAGRAPALAGIRAWRVWVRSVRGGEASSSAGCKTGVALAGVEDEGCKMV